METIKKIEEVFDVGEGYATMDGYKITTDKQEILFLISNMQSCCEQWGYFSTNDDYTNFIGSNLVGIKTVDVDMVPESLKQNGLEYGLDEGDIIFINIETSNGTFQLAVYNAHNGYYGHSVKLISNQLNLDAGV